MNQHQRDPVTAAIDQALHALAAGGGDLPDHANRLGGILFSPPRVLVVGRLKAGKSTLVNALIGDNVAATGALETTNAVTVFRHGAPSRAEVVGNDGRRSRGVLDDGVLVDVGRPVPEVAYVDRYLPSAAVEQMTIIDTPGIATLTVDNRDATQRALIDGYAQTRDASVDADAAVFLFDSAPRADERGFVGKLGFTPLNTIGVLARADSFGEGAFGRRDPLDHADRYCGVLRGRLASLMGEVVPVSGLMAESAATGRVTEPVARAVATLGRLAPEDLVEELESDAPTRIDRDVRDRALDLLGEYGVARGAEVAAGGAVALNDWLEQRSGIARLRRVLGGGLLRYATLGRAARLLHQLELLGYSHERSAHVRHVHGVLSSQPAMTPVMLFTAYRGLAATSPGSRLMPMLHDALSGATPAERLGLPAAADPAHVQRRAREMYGELQQMALVGRSAAEEDSRVRLLAMVSALLS
ncbi:dynamin family protein [uncultured Corynebacterium sp.]|uniref:dynamin family protein n=1 Tax=uncultured Corynebacterium sp. TaxID=159447 RepID=UPI0025F720E5|nr:dynamin family protein [uncultured Corynebacterium sp.]